MAVINRTLIVGTGAIASFIAEKLHANQSTQVSVIGNWKTGRERLTSQGIKTISPQEATVQDYDLVIVARKFFQNQNSINILGSIVNKETPILIIQNGVTNLEDFMKEGYTNVSLGMITYGAKFDDALNLIVSEKGLLIIDSKFNFLSSLLQDFGVEFSNDIEHILHKKLVVNCMLNGLSAIENVVNGALLDSKYTSRLAALRDEAISVVKMKGFPVNIDEIQALANKVFTESAENTSSTLSDVLNKRQTEISGLNGHIVQLGRKFGIATPENNRIWREITEIEANY